MRFVGTLLVTIGLVTATQAQESVGAATAASATVNTGIADKPYADIVARNMFGLVPIPPPDPNADKPPADPPPKITPTGIMTIFGRLQALFKVANKGKANQPAKEDAYVLAEGERQDDVEILKIDQPNRTITFNNHGIVQELPLMAAKDGGPAEPAKGGSSSGAGLGIPRPGTMSPADRAAFFRARAAERMGTANPGGIPNPANNPGTPPSYANPNSATSSFGHEVNERGIYQPRSDTSGMTPEQSALLIEAQRKVYEEQGNPMAPLLPPTSGEARQLLDQLQQNSQ